jgi:type II secretory pathway component GspD/PulD (secretin)
MLIMAFGRLGSIRAQGADTAQGQGAGRQEEARKTSITSVPGLEIKRLESDKPLYSFELREVQLKDFFRIIARDYNLNIIVDQDVSGAVTTSFSHISLEEALSAIAELSNLSLEKKGNFIKVSPNLITRTVILKYIEAKKILGGTAPVQGGACGSLAPESLNTGLCGLLSAKGKILLSQQQNSLIVIDSPDSIKRIEDYLKIMDHKMETRVFKLKYLKAEDVVGAESKDSKEARLSTSPAGAQSGPMIVINASNASK